MYNIIFIYFFILVFNIVKNVVYGENLSFNIVGYGDHINTRIFSNMVQDFNDFSEANKLNITLELEMVDKVNNEFDSYSGYIESVLHKKNNKYDILIYDNSYTQKYGPNLLDLKDYVKDDISIFDEILIKDSCTYKDKLVGLPFKITITMLFSNRILLEKYEKPIPKTWDELKATSTYIYEREKENNPSLIRYNGLYEHGENGVCSIYEFIHSFRNSREDPFPGVDSDIAVKALNYLKEMKNEIASDDIFSSDYTFNRQLLIDANAIFIKFYTLPYDLGHSIPYNMSALPGYKSGVSGGIIAGYNIGVDASMDKKKYDAAAIIVKFLTSYDVQKKYVISENLVSGIPSIYKDEEVCETVNCEAMVNFQPVGRPSSELYKNSDLANKILESVYKFLYENKISASEALKNVVYLTKIYQISLFHDNASTTGLLIAFYTISVFLMLLMLLSLLFLKSKKLTDYFSYLSSDSWIISIIGLVIVICSSFTLLESVSVKKCKLFVILLILGYSLNLMPIFHKMIADFPVENKISAWAKNNKYKFFLCCFINIALLIVLYSLDIYNVDILLINEGMNYKTCTLKSIAVLIVVIVYYVLLIISMLILCYVEWYNRTVIFDIQYIVFAIYSDTLSIIILIIIDTVKLKNCNLEFIIKCMSILLPAITSYVSIYGIRIFLGNTKKSDNDDKIGVVRGYSNNNSEKHSDTNSNNIFLRLRELHNNSVNVINGVNSGTNYGTYNNTISNNISQKGSNTDTNKQMTLKTAEMNSSTDSKYSEV